MGVIIIAQSRAAAGDVVAPVISDIDYGTGFVSWHLDEPATGQVEYGPTASFGYLSTLETGYLLYHYQTIPALVAGWYFRIHSIDASGNEAVSDTYTIGGIVTRPWPLPVTTGTYYVPNLGSGDVTAALNAYIATVPNGKIINFGGRTYTISSCINLSARNNLIFDGAGGTLINVNNDALESGSFFYQPNSGTGASHITIKDFSFVGPNPTPGSMEGDEHQSFLRVHIGSYYELDNISGTGLRGDVATFQSGASYGWVHDCTISDCGRNFVSVVWGNHILVERNTFGKAGWSIFDIEPTTTSNGQTMTDIIFRDNVCGTWDLPTHGFFFGNSSLVGSSANVDNVVISGNTVTGNNLQSIIGFNTLGRRTYLTFTGNTGIASPIYQAMPGMLSLKASDHAVITGNIQPRVPGDTKPFVYAYSGCTDIVSQ